MAAGVALGHPPHAHQRVGARAQHQLLQVADPFEVPRLRRREDPLAQPPYARLDRTPINSVPVKARVLWSVHHADMIVVASNLSSGSGGTSSFSSQAHLTASARFRVRAPCVPVSGQLCGSSQPEGPAIMSRFPVAFRLPAFASRSSESRRGTGPSSRSAYRPNSPDLDGGYRVSHARATTGVGASCIPRTTVLSRLSGVPSRRLPLPSGQSLALRYSIPPAELTVTRHQSEVQVLHPSGLPLACSPRMERAPLGFCLMLRTPPGSPATHVRPRPGHKHGPGTTRSTSAEPPIREFSRQRATSRRSATSSHRRERPAPDRSPRATPSTGRQAHADPHDRVIDRPR